MRAVRLGVLGCGWIAGNRLRQIAGLGLAEVTLVADRDRPALERIRTWAPQARIAEGVDAFDRDRVDAVMVSTPSALHCDQSLALLERGLPVFVQKPVGLSSAQVQRVFDAAARADVPLATDFCYRDLHSSRAIRAALSEGRLGHPFLVEGCFHNAYRPGSGWAYDPRFAGGGALMDLGIHLMDLVAWLTGSRLTVNDVYLRSAGTPWRDGAVETFAMVDLTSGADVPVRLIAGWDASTGREAEIRLRLYGERGTLELVNRSGSFYDFDARYCLGTEQTGLASDDGDSWQAGPLTTWLRLVRSGAGYLEPQGVREVMVLIDEAYALARTRRMDSTTARETVHALGKQGALP